jgi:hypothetical protein
MADIVPNVVVSMPSQLFTLARSFKAAANGRIYIGKIDTDPTIPENQIQVYLENEDGSHVPMAQPIMINAGGYPVYGGQIAKFVTVQGHSMAVYDAFGVQQFYFPNVLKYDPDQLRTELAGPDGVLLVGNAVDKRVLAGPDGYNMVGAGDTTLAIALGHVMPEMFGAKADGTTDDADAINAAFATGRHVISGTPGGRYRTTRTLRFPSNDMKGQKIDFLGSTIFADHVQAVFSGPDVQLLPRIDNIHFQNMNVEGIAGVDSIYNDVVNNGAFALGDNSSVRNVSVKNIGTDAFSFNGFNGKGEELYCDNIRDNPIAMRGTHNYVSSIKVGHCAGDMLLMKGSYNRVESASGKKCGVPGSNPEPGFIAGGIAIFGAPVDGDDLGRNNSVGFVEVDQWGALGIGFSGNYCRVDTMKLGVCYYTDDSPQVQNSKPWVAIIRGTGSSIGEIRSQGSPYGVLMLSANECTIANASILGATKVQIQLNNTAVNCSIGKISVDKYSQWGIIPNGTNCSIENLIMNNCIVPQGITAAHLTSPTVNIENITINGGGAGSGSGTAVELLNAAIVGNITSSSFSGTALIVRPTGKVPRMANLSNNTDSTVPIAIISSTNSCCCGWIIRNFNGPGQPTVFQEAGTTVVSTWVGCENSIPVAQGGATLNAATNMNRFY